MQLHLKIDTNPVIARCWEASRVTSENKITQEAQGTGNKITQEALFKPSRGVFQRSEYHLLKANVNFTPGRQAWSKALYFSGGMAMSFSHI